MTVDHDGKIRMDCSSPYAMARLVRAEGPLSRRVRQRSGRRPARHRHAVGGAPQSEPLSRGRDPLPADAPPGVARAARRSARRWCRARMIDRVVASLGRKLCEVPVGFKWFVAGLLDGSFCFGGEESAGASFLRRDGSVWTTDKDGLVLDLLAAEMTARTGRDPGEHYRDLAARIRLAACTRGSTRRRRRSRRRDSRSSRPRRSRRRCSRGSRSRRAHARSGQRRRHRRSQGDRPRTAGSPRGRRAPRTSTSCTRRASGTSAICRRSSPRRGRSSSGAGGAGRRGVTAAGR